MESRPHQARWRRDRVADGTRSARLTGPSPDGPRAAIAWHGLPGRGEVARTNQAELPPREPTSRPSWHPSSRKSSLRQSGGRVGPVVPRRNSLKFAGTGHGLERRCASPCPTHWSSPGRPRPKNGAPPVAARDSPSPPTPTPPNKFGGEGSQYVRRIARNMGGTIRPQSGRTGHHTAKHDRRIARNMGGTIRPSYRRIARNMGGTIRPSLAPSVGCASGGKWVRVGFASGGSQ